MAQKLNTEIVSCDSRQFYKELNIGVARPSEEELAAVPHHFIACRSVNDPYNVFTYEQEALSCIDRLFKTHENVIAVGGSGLYIEALSNGISILPDPTPELRNELQQKFKNEGVESLASMLKQHDPEYYNQVDLANGVRIQRALEVCIMTGKPYSQIIKQPKQQRPFEIETIVLQRDRDDLRRRIDLRVDLMFKDGLEAEVRNLYGLRHLTPLNTVGYKEFFNLWASEDTNEPCNSANMDNQARNLSDQQIEEVSNAIKLNTWHYAKKQITWFKKKANQSKIITL